MAEMRELPEPRSVDQLYYAAILSELQRLTALVAELARVTKAQADTPAPKRRRRKSQEA